MSRPGPLQDPADRALQRLRRLPPNARPTPPPFTCDLSVDELLLTAEAGLQPLQLVMGSCVFHIAPRFSVNATRELEHLSKAMTYARAMAMGHLRAEARRLSAHGVVGVRVELDFERWGEELCEFTAMGTAVRDRSDRLGTRGQSFTCHLSGQEFAALLAAGYRPLALVMGAAVWQVARQRARAWLASRGRNLELTSFTEALSTARERAMARMEREARTARATGVVGVSVEERNHAWGSHTIEFLAMGTAVRPLPGKRPPAEPGLVVPVDAPTVRAAGIAVSAGPLGRARATRLRTSPGPTAAPGRSDR